jgi:rare lipoprotein A
MRRIFAVLFLCCCNMVLLGQAGIGVASYYSSKFEGRKTASGAIFSNKKMTAASNHFKLGQRVRVTNVHNGKTVVVEVIDRMSKNNKRLIDLTQEAARMLCFMDEGLCKVKVEPISKQEQSEGEELPIVQDSVAIIE